MRLRGDLIEMYIVIRGLYQIDWSKSPLLKTNIYFTGPDQGVRGNKFRLLREAFKSSARNKFVTRSVTQRDRFFTNRVSPR